MIFAWLRQLKKTFGVPFLLLVVSVYWTQVSREFSMNGLKCITTFIGFLGKLKQFNGSVLATSRGASHPVNTSNLIDS